MTKDVRLKLYPVLVAILGLGVALLLVSRLNISAWVEPAPPQTSNPVTTEPLPLPETPLKPDISNSNSTDIASPLPSTGSSEASNPSNPEGSPSAIHRGKLRVSNQTDHPLRVALLPQQSDANIPEPKTDRDRPPFYSEPVHWDFAPQEGSAKGLILSLPGSSLQLQEGDVLVAFAQDGSRRYWGPYMVGKTALPVWSANTNEWQLVLQP